MNLLYCFNSGNFGGMEKHVVALAAGMHNRGHKVFVWCKSGPVATQLKELGINVATIAIDSDLDLPYIASLVKFLKQESIDVIHAHELKAVVNCMLAGKLAGTSVRISHTHTPISEWQIAGFKKRLNITVNSLVVNLFSSREIALTESRKAVKEHEGIKSNKLAIIPNGIETETFTLTSDDKAAFREEVLTTFSIPVNAFVFGNLSRLTKEKGHNLLLDGFSKFLVKSQNKGLDTSSIYLLIAGGGALEQPLRAQIAELGLENKVVVTGVFEDSMLPKFYAAFNAFVFPSLAEGFGFVLAEAMCSKLSIICSDLPVLHEVGGATVMYFESGNSAELAEKLYDLYTRYEQFAPLREQACERVLALFSVEAFVTKHEQLYLAMLEDNK